MTSRHPFLSPEPTILLVCARGRDPSSSPAPEVRDSLSNMANLTGLKLQNEYSAYAHNLGAAKGLAIYPWQTNLVFPIFPPGLAVLIITGEGGMARFS